MLSRCQTVDYLSPCRSRNRKCSDHPFHRPNGWPFANGIIQSPEADGPQKSGSARRSETILMIKGGRRAASSTSLPPSEFCTSYHSFPTQDQSSSIISNDGKNSEETKMELFRQPDHLQTLNNPSPIRISRDDAEEREEGGCKEDHHLAADSILSSDDGYFTTRSGSGSEYENSDIESVIEEHRERQEPPRTPATAEARRNEVEANLTEWREVKTMKIINRLRKEESGIDRWEKKQTTKAKMDMKEFELKLERKRERALEEMQRKIKIMQKKAAKKKLKERASAAKKISRVA